MKNIDIRALDNMPLDELAKLPAAVLVDLQDEADNALAEARRRRANLDSVLARRYGDLVGAGLREQGKDTGTVRLTDGDYPVVCEIKKSVYWNADKLTELRDTIAAAGDDPGVYIVTKTELTVREASYATWPAPVRAVFEPARTVKAGKPQYRIERPAAGAA